jgi:hypothetical protein
MMDHLKTKINKSRHQLKSPTCLVTRIFQECFSARLLTECFSALPRTLSWPVGLQVVAVDLELLWNIRRHLVDWCWCHLPFWSRLNIKSLSLWLGVCLRGRALPSMLAVVDSIRSTANKSAQLSRFALQPFLYWKPLSVLSCIDLGELTASEALATPCIFLSVVLLPCGRPVPLPLLPSKAWGFCEVQLSASPAYLREINRAR